MYKKCTVHKKGFTLIELLVVISIISLLSSIVMASLSSAKAKARDTRRLSDMKQIEIALELYRGTFGVYPNSDYDASVCGGWDSGGDGTFITALITNKFLPSHVLDPINNYSCGNYSYYRYSENSYGCIKPFYTLGIRDLEASGAPHPTSPGWSCPTRNWQGEFEWVVGKEE